MKVIKVRLKSTKSRLPRRLTMTCSMAGGRRTKDESGCDSSFVFRQIYLLAHGYLRPVIGEEALGGEGQAFDGGAKEDAALAVVEGKPADLVDGDLLGLVVEAHPLGVVALDVGRVG